MWAPIKVKIKRKQLKLNGKHLYIQCQFYHELPPAILPQVHDHMTKNGIEVRDYGVVESDVASLASGEQQMFSSLPNVEFTEDGSNGL